MELVPLESQPSTPDVMQACKAAWDRGAAVYLQPPEEAEPPPLDEVPADVGIVVRTTGTTGNPKAVMIGRAALETAADLTNQALGAGADSRWLACLPLDRIGGFGVLMRAERLGAPAIVHDRFDVDRVASADADFVSLVPTMLRRLLDGGVDLARFTILLGGGPIPAELVEEAGAAGARVVRSYGMTETCGGVVYDGQPLPGVEVGLDAAGRISIASPTLMDGYLSARPGEGLSEGTFVTSDRGRWVGGRLQVLGRMDRTIVTGGEKVAAEWVESALLECRGVSEAFVFGAPDPEWGERVVALVVGASDAAEIEVELRTKLPAPMIPKVLELVTSIPRLPTGEPDRASALDVLES